MRTVLLLALCFPLFADDACLWGIPAESVGSVVVVVTLEKSSDDALPVIGADEIRRLGVQARIDEIRKGTFRWPAGAHVTLAVHSIALTFGGDFVGEQYDVGFEPTPNGDYAMRSILPSVSRRLLIRGVIAKPVPQERTIDFGDDDARTVHVRTESGEHVTLKLALRKGARPQLGKAICVLALVRPDRKDRPYRVVRSGY